MASRLPLAPLPKIASRRKSRVCTREACEVCREKKAKCDGEMPCSRCKTRGEECQYQTRSHQTKRSLQAELEELKDAQRQRDAVLEALTAPGQTQDVLRRLWSGETFDRIYENLEMHSLASPTTSPVSDSSSHVRHIKEEPSLTPFQTPLCSPPIMDYSNSAGLHRSGTSHIHGSIENQGSTIDCMKDGPDGLMPHAEPSIFSQTAPIHGIYEQCAADYTPTLPFGTFVDDNAPLILPDAYYADHAYPPDDIGNINWWQPGISDPMLPGYNVPPSTNLNAWLYPQFTAPHLPGQAQDSHSQPLSTPSPVVDNSPLISRSASREEPRRSMTSSTVSAGESQYPTPPPPKKRKLQTKGQVSSTTAGTGSRSKSDDNAPPETKASSKPPSQESPSHDRERHRRASARNWQKQKQQTADLEAAMKLAESRNRELHREYAEVLSQVMDVKNALMDHARCNHPAISSWLRSQATKYVLNKGAAVDKEPGDQVGTGDMGAPTYSVERKSTACR